MNEYKFQQRRKKRGDWCLMPAGPMYGNGLCGCGTRNEPPPDYKTRIIRRELKRQLREEMENVHEIVSRH